MIIWWPPPCPPSRPVWIVPTDLGDMEHILRSTANRVGIAIVIAALLIASALMAQVNHTLSVVGFCGAAALGLLMIWKIVRTPGEL